MKKKENFTIFTSLMLVLAMYFCTLPASAAASSVSDDSGEMSYIEFTVPEDASVNPRSMQSFVETVTVLPEWFPGKEVVAEHNKLTVSAKGANMGITVSVQLKVKGLFDQYYNVSNASRTLTCDGNTHTLFNGFEVQSGKTYRFYYRANGSYTQTPSVTLSAVFWD